MVCSLPLKIETMISIVGTVLVRIKEHGGTSLEVIPTSIAYIVLDWLVVKEYGGATLPTITFL